MIGEPSTPSQSPYPQVQQPEPVKHTYRWVIFLLLGVLGLTFLCAALVAGLVIKNLSDLPANMGSSQSLVDQFMQAGVEQDANAAFVLFSDRGQLKMPLTRIETLFSNANRDLFIGYRNLQVTSYNIHTGSGDDPFSDLNLPDGTFIILRGTIHYNDDVDSTFSAVLEQLGQDMKLYNIDIGVPPSRFRGNQSG
jgi:hypothetical protein